MKLEIQTKTTIETTITPPMYWQKGNDWRALISDNDYRNIYQSGNTTTIIMNDPERHLADIEDAFLTWPQISELEFITKMDEVLESISLTPKMKA